MLRDSEAGRDEQSLTLDPSPGGRGKNSSRQGLRKLSLSAFMSGARAPSGAFGR